ncbi:MAG TPA: serine/threonine-protein kinase [Vicinamibacteria bacterium]|jgi:serine/threonine protein kinase/Tfp pilus assembly protein PilF|nr:serine/threonine-protein kinase [Vicinamibacteria bacterium]
MPRLSGERWQVVSPYLDRALEMAADERAAWLESLRAEDSTLVADLVALLEERSRLSQEGFLEGSALLPPSSASLAGQTIGAYTLVSLIGQGGMGSVWLARRSDGRFEGQAALKLLNASLVGRAGEERFKREGSILARLTHPHIAHLVDAGLSPTGQPYLVLEHVEGEQIDRYCDGKGLGIEARIRVFLDVLAAVAHAHANLVVHRDIKPSNVMVGMDGQVKLLDFGIAKLLEEETGAGEATALTREGGRALTLEYAAPEQVTGGLITTATDVYSLGVLLYVILTGRHPAGAALMSSVHLLKAIVDTEPPRLSHAVAETKENTPEKRTRTAALRATTPDGLRRLVKGDLDTIVAKALKKNPAERYASVTVLADDLRRYLNHEPISARPDTLAYRAAKFVRRHARGVATAGAVILLLAVVVGFYTASLAAERDRARREAQKAAKVSELLTGLLTGADPYATHEEKEPSVRGLLDAGAERIQKELADQPDLQAEMLTVMGRVYQRLGAHEKAQPLLEEALAAGRRVLGPEHERVAQSLNDLGVLLDEKGDYTAAAPMLEQALAMRRKLLGPEHKDVAVTLVELGRVYRDQGFDERAEPLVRESLAIRRKVLGEEDHETATSESDLALLLWHKGDLAGAESLLRQCLATDRKTRGDDHPDVATTLNNLAGIAIDRYDYAAAERLSRQALVIGRKTLGEKHPTIATKLNSLSNALREQGKYDEAALVLQEALQIALPALGNDHPRIASYKVNLARVHLARKKAAAAEPLLRQALRIQEHAFPEDDWRVGQTKSLLGEALTALARYDEAERSLIAAHGILKDVPGQQGREATATRSRLVALYEAWGRPEKAAAYRPGARPQQ